ncbi:MAG: ATP-binding cassette domain-containing protein, partial [Candidatus Micrarchaeota archaeon]
MLEVNGLSKYFANGTGAVHALDGVGFGVRQAEAVAVLGPSGCGKSTLLRIISGLLPPSAGEVLLNGERVVRPTPAVGMVHQNNCVFPWLTAQANVEFGLKLLEVEAGKRRALALEHLRAVGLAGFENHYPAQLSGGMAQRVALARALATQPDLLLLDEPLGSLDVHTRTRTQAVLATACREARQMLLLVT